MYKATNALVKTHCNCGTIPGSADEGVMGVIGPGVDGPMEFC
jgi:hypothetical protein